jgi:hypothetical protein
MDCSGSQSKANIAGPAFRCVFVFMGGSFRPRSQQAPRHDVEATVAELSRRITWIYEAFRATRRPERLPQERPGYRIGETLTIRIGSSVRRSSATLLSHVLDLF